MVTLYCPQCGNHLFNYDENASSHLSIACKKCNIFVTRRADGQITTGEIPKRTTSSGMRFIR